jgi:hypothetical protein
MRCPALGGRPTARRRTVRPGPALAALLVCLLAPPLAQAAEQPTVEVDVTISNDFDKPFTNLPVFLKVFRVFGRGVDYTRFDPDGFVVLDAQGKELHHVVRPVPPDFSLANDDLVVFLPGLAKGETVNLRILNAPKSGRTSHAYAPDLLLGNPNNLISNGGFEHGTEGWEGGKLAHDGVQSGKGALLLEVPGDKGQAVLRCTQPLRFSKGKNYHFSIWAKCENVVRRTWRFNYRPAPISARIMLSGDPLVFPELDTYFDKNHVMRLMDTRDWFCYEANDLSTLCLPRPALADCESTLSLALDQVPVPYLDATKPARVWIDEALLFEQPRVDVSWERMQTAQVPDGMFLFRRAPTALTPLLLKEREKLEVLPPPRPSERVTAIADAALQGERKLVTIGLYTPRALKAVTLGMSDLKGPRGAVLRDTAWEIEFHYTPQTGFRVDGDGLEGWVLDGNAPREIDRPGSITYLVGLKIPAKAVPGMYRGRLAFLSDGKELASLPLELEVVGQPLQVITEHRVGLIYNGGCEPDRPGVSAPAFNNDFLRYYARNNFSYLMLFRSFVPFKEKTAEVDLLALVTQVKEACELGGITAGIGLYQDVSLDKQGNKKGPDGGRGLWPRSGNNPDVYRKTIGEMDAALKKARLPPFTYMVWDEPRFCDPAKFGILKGTGALTTSDITYLEACEAMKQGLFTHTAIDGPGCDYGPAMRRYAEKLGVKIGWDTQFGPFCNRYQTGLMLANGAWLISDWHSAWYIVQHQGQKTWARSPALVGAAEGMIDFRYHLTLQDLIAQAKRTGKAAKAVQAAEDDQKRILAFCTDDFHFITDKEIFTYVGPQNVQPHAAHRAFRTSRGV